MKSLKNPFAVDDKGNTIFINDLKNHSRLDNKNSRYYCMECHQEMIVKMGEKNQWHFSHKRDKEGLTGNCSGNIESYLHQYAKELVKRNTKLLLPPLSVKNCYEMHPNESVFKGDFERYLKEDSVNMVHLVQSSVFDRNVYKYHWLCNEIRIDEFIPDCLVEIGDKQLAIEILVTHSVDENKADKVKTTKIDMIEIDLSEISINDLEDKNLDLGKYIIYEAPRKWIYKTFIKKFEERVYDVIYNEGIFIVNNKYTRKESLRKLYGRKQKKLMEEHPEEYRRKMEQRKMLKIPKIIEEYVNLNQNKQPSIFNIPVRGEYAFQCERSVWQAELLNRFILYRQGKTVQLSKINSYFDYYSAIKHYKEFDFNKNYIWYSKYDAIKYYIIRLIQIEALRETSTYDNLTHWEDLEIICTDINKLNENLKKLDISYKRTTCHSCGMVIDNPSMEEQYYLFQFGMDKECFGEYVKENLNKSNN